MPASEPHLTLLTSSDDSAAEEAGLVLAEAFDPSSNHLQRALFVGVELGAVREATRLQMLQIVYRGVRDKEVWVASTASGDNSNAARPIGAVMIVSPPASKDARDTRPETPYDAALAAATPPATSEAFAQLNAQSYAKQEAAYDPPKEEGYHVSMLGTAANSRRQGLAGALVHSVLRRAGVEGRTVTLTTHTEENAEYYGRLGFTLLDRNTFDVRGTPVTFWILAKSPEAAEASHAAPGA